MISKIYRSCLSCGKLFLINSGVQRHCGSLSCRRERNRRLSIKWYYENPEKIHSMGRRYYAENKEKIKQLQIKIYRSRNYGPSVCELCRSEYTKWRPNQKYCSKKCQENVWESKGRYTRFNGDSRNSELGRKGRMKQVFPKKFTSIERIVHEELKRRDITFQSNLPIMGICQADIVFPEARVAVFCDGDYWHHLPSYVERDRRINETLRSSGWVVLRFWESEIQRNITACIDIIESVLGSGKEVIL